MNLLADENFPKLSVKTLRNEGYKVDYILESNPGISDEGVMKIGIDNNLLILTLDSDFGELIFKHGFKPPQGVIYFRLPQFSPEKPAKILIELLASDFSTESSLTVIDDESIRQRKY